jgi:hypothetical protein
MAEISEDEGWEEFNDRLIKYSRLGPRWFHFPTASLIISAMSFAFTSIIALLHLVHAITAADIFTNPFLLMGIIIMNLAAVLAKDVIISRVVDYKMGQLNKLSKDIAKYINKARLKTLTAHLPVAIEADVDKPLPVLQARANAVAIPLTAKPELRRSISFEKLMLSPRRPAAEPDPNPSANQTVGLTR